jgi:L-fucose isomerase-like protein
MKIAYIPLSAENHQNSGLLKRFNFLFPEIKLYEEGDGDYDSLVLLILSGGAEITFKQLDVGRFPKDLLVVAEGANNSLAAGLEILTWLRKYHQYNRRLFLLDSEDSFDQGILKRYFTARTMLEGKKVGLLGNESPWLIGSEWDAKLLEKRLKIEFASWNLTQLIEEATPVLGEEEKPGIRAKMFRDWLLDFCRKNQLSAFSLKCFDMIQPLKTTGCLALAEAADEGITAGCEGDIPTLLSLLLVESFTGKPAFMANPSNITLSDNTITLAHCTVPPSFTEKVEKTTHFETGGGISLKGDVKGNEFFLFKTDGYLKNYQLFTGKKIILPWRKDLCRTQLTLEIKEDLRQLLQEPIGNHLVIFQKEGFNKAEFEEYIRLFQV